MVQLKFAAIAEVNRLHRKRLAKQTAEGGSNGGSTSVEQVPRLRVTIIPGGCMGMVYNLALVDAVHPSDRVFHQTSIDSDSQRDIEVVVDEGSLPYIQDLVLDYSEDLMGGGFRFHNPKVSQSCGCGNSFAALS